MTINREYRGQLLASDIHPRIYIESHGEDVCVLVEGTSHTIWFSQQDARLMAIHLEKAADAAQASTS